MNPHAKVVQQWNKFFVISCLVAIFVDPLFFFLLSVLKVCFSYFIYFLKDDFCKYKVRFILKLLMLMSCALDKDMVSQILTWV
jgi:hypothetical protein